MEELLKIVQQSLVNQAATEGKVKELEVIINKIATEYLPKIVGAIQELKESKSQKKEKPVSEGGGRKKTTYAVWEKVDSLSRKGVANKDIAKELGISASTVSNYLTWNQDKVEAKKLEEENGEI